MHWSHPDTLGDVPPPCRAHTATLVSRPVCYDSTYIFDTTTRSWFCPSFPHSQSSLQNLQSQELVSHTQNPPEKPLHPAPRRAHTAVLYNGKIYIFGGGNGLTALNDLWALDTYSYGGGSFGGSASGGLRWPRIETHGEPPVPRGYHTANLVGNVMIVIGGSDGRECFSGVWCLHLDTLVWTRLNLPLSHRRLSHTSTQVGSYLFIVGGHDGGAYRDEVVLFNLVHLQYEPRTVKGKAPSARGYHVTIIADSRLFVFGGFNGHDVFDDVHILDLAGAAYLPQVMSFRIDV
ncbi:galactose oxidase [Suillus ampliporus]|nr:galactose oxidase [Suillus ampliporus]